jgi:nucleoside-triphosphatase THEP1
MVLKVLESSNKVLGTISVSKFEFIREIYKRKDTEMIKVNLKNRDRLADKIIKNWFLNQFS